LIAKLALRLKFDEPENDVAVGFAEAAEGSEAVEDARLEWS
jgi:hypothetical protein